MSSRLLWLTVGVVSTLCGIAGVVLPLVPTTPFLLLAAFSFGRSSPRMENWLIAHPRLGPPIVDWQTRGAIGRRAKILAVVAMGATLAISLVAALPKALILVQAAVLAAVATFILSRPTATDADRRGRQ